MGLDDTRNGGADDDPDKGKGKGLLASRDATFWFRSRFSTALRRVLPRDRRTPTASKTPSQP